MASGMDQNRVIDFLNVSVGESAPGAGTAVLAAGFNAGASNRGHIRLMTTNGSSTANGTELGSGGSYTAVTGIIYTTGTAGQFAGATYSSGSGTTNNNATLSQANMPGPNTIVGIEIWDSAGTPLRWWWGSLTSSVSVNNGDTLSFSSSAIVATLTA